MDNDRSTLGKVSLNLSIIGVIVPVLLAALITLFRSPPKDNGMAMSLCVVLSIILETVALGCGISARRTVEGRVGMDVTIVLLVLAVVAFLSMGVRRRKGPVDPVMDAQPLLSSPKNSPQPRK